MRTPDVEKAMRDASRYEASWTEETLAAEIERLEAHVAELKALREQDRAERIAIMAVAKKDAETAEARVAELEALCRELKNALACANDFDAAAEGENSANFRHMRREFDLLATRAGKALAETKGTP